MNPTLCRFLAYFAPGLPRPTIRYGAGPEASTGSADAFDANTPIDTDLLPSDRRLDCLVTLEMPSVAELGRARGRGEAL